MIEAMKLALEALEAVLCNPEGKCCIKGSDMDRLEVDMSLATFRQAIKQYEKQKPVGVVYSVPVGQVVGPDDTLKFAHTVLSDDRLLLNQSLYNEPQPQREWDYDALYSAWHAVGADLAGLKWDNFVAKLKERNHVS